MDLKIVTTQSDFETIQLTKIAIRWRLYVNGWSLRKYFRAALKDPSGYRIAIAYSDNVPVGVTLFRLGMGENGENHVVCFVRSKFRRQGIATKLTQSLIASCPGGVYAQYGFKKSRNFFNAIGIEVIN